MPSVISEYKHADCRYAVCRNTACFKFQFGSVEGEKGSLCVNLSSSYINSVFVCAHDTFPYPEICKSVSLENKGCSCVQEFSIAPYYVQ